MGGREQIYIYICILITRFPGESAPEVRGSWDDRRIPEACLGAERGGVGGAMKGWLVRGLVGVF